MAQQNRLVWNPQHRESRAILEPYLDIQRLKPDGTADDYTYLREMNRIDAVFCSKQDRKSKWLLYRLDTIINQVINRAGEQKLSLILAALKMSWCDVYPKIDVNRFTDFLARHHAEVDVAAHLFELVRSGFDTQLSPSELLNKHRNLTSSHKAP